MRCSMFGIGFDVFCFLVYPSCLGLCVFPELPLFSKRCFFNTNRHLSQELPRMQAIQADNWQPCHMSFFVFDLFCTIICIILCILLWLYLFLWCRTCQINMKSWLEIEVIYILFVCSCPIQHITTLMECIKYCTLHTENECSVECQIINGCFTDDDSSNKSKDNCWE